MARHLSSITVTERSGNAFPEERPEERPDEGSRGELETNLMDALSCKKFLNGDTSCLQGSNRRNVLNIVCCYYTGFCC